MIRAVLFDLDDTLYVERDFFRSGFAAVARHLESRGVGETDVMLAMLEAIHRSEGREQVFDKLARRLGLPRHWVPDLVLSFRSHWPRIALAPEVARALFRLRRRYKLGCITDGRPDVQRRKIQVLGLDALLDAVIYTADGGREGWKPSPLPFAACCTLLDVGRSEAVYVGDNPERDMRGARRAGLVSVRIRREGGYFADVAADGDPADHEISSIEQLEPLLETFDEDGVVV